MAARIERVVVDTCTLFHRHPRALLIWLAYKHAYTLYLSPGINRELRKHLIRRAKEKAEKQGWSSEKRADVPSNADTQIKNIRAILEKADAGGVLPGKLIEELIPLMTNDPKDHHVLAARTQPGTLKGGGLCSRPAQAPRAVAGGDAVGEC